MTFFSPTLRSRRFGHRLLTARVVVLVGLFTWLTPALFGVVMVLASSILLPTEVFDSPFPVFLASGGLLMFAPVYGILLVPLGLLVGAWAMRFGVAGWASAVGASLILPLAFGVVFQALDPTAAAIGAALVLTPAIVLHAAAMWIATRHLCPQALIDPAPSNTLP